MANNGTIITAPVQMTDIQAVLGETKSDLIGICQSEKINPWAKYKPVIRRNMIEATSDYWKADDGMCGFAPSFETSSRAQLNNLFNADNRKWVYKPPQGGLNAPCRQGDFKNYNHNALNPFAEQLKDQTISISSQNKATITWFESLIGDPEGDMLCLENFTKANVPLSEWYYGVILSSNENGTVGSGSRTICCTAERTNSREIVIDVPTSWAGTYYAVPFLSLTKFKNADAYSVQEQFICIPQTNLAKIKLTSDGSLNGVSMMVGGQYLSNNRFKVTIFFRNNSSSAVTFSNIGVLVNHTASNLGQWDMGVLDGSVYLAANSSVTKEYTFETLAQGYRWVKVGAKVGTGTVESTWTAILDDGIISPIM